MKFLKNIDVKVLSSYTTTFFEDKLLAFGYSINKSQHIRRTHVDWQLLKGFCFMYDYIGNEEIVALLKNSNLCNPERKLILELNSKNSIIEISSSLFAEHWEDIINENSLGVSGISTDSDLVFEFSDDSNYLLYSNFLIKA
jgi:hypothetical protein